LKRRNLKGDKMFGRFTEAGGLTAGEAAPRERKPDTEAAGQADLSKAVFPGTDQYESLVSRLIGGLLTYEQFCKKLEESRA
jgi:hypothetical protein